MKFMVLIYGSHTAWDALGPAEVEELAKVHADIKRELFSSGEFVSASELDDAVAMNVRTADGSVVRTPEPFSEGEHILGGYYIVDCVDLARATDIAARFAEVRFAPIEVRRLGDGSSWDKPQPG